MDKMHADEDHGYFPADLPKEKAKKGYANGGALGGIVSPNNRHCTELRTVIAKLVGFVCDFDRDDIIGLLGVRPFCKLDGRDRASINRYLSRLVNDGVLVKINDVKFRAGPQAERFRRKTPRYRMSVNYGHGRSYKQKKLVMQSLLHRDAIMRNKIGYSSDMDTTMDKNKVDVLNRRIYKAFYKTENTSHMSNVGGACTFEDLRMMSVYDAAALLNVSASTIRNLIARGKINGVRICPHIVRVPEKAIREYRDTLLREAAEMRPYKLKEYN